MSERIFLFFIIVSIFLIGCNPSQIALWQKQKETGYNGGLLREVTVYNTFTGSIVFHRIGKCFIEDEASKGDFMILWSENNTKTDFLGQGLSMVALEISDIEKTNKGVTK